MKTALQTLFLLLIIAAGFALGLFLRGWLMAADVPENLSGSFQSTGPDAGKPAQLEGWCCKSFGQSCTEVGDPLTCLRGGQAFNVDQAVCDEICNTAI